jgi:hypothetical protein
MNNTIDVTLTVKNVNGVLAETYSKMGKSLATTRDDLVNMLDTGDTYSHRDVVEIIDQVIVATVETIDGHLPRFTESESLLQAYYAQVNT